MKHALSVTTYLTLTMVITHFCYAQIVKNTDIPKIRTKVLIISLQTINEENIDICDIIFNICNVFACNFIN